MCLSLLEGAVVRQQSEKLREWEQNGGPGTPFFLVAATSYVLQNLLKNKCELFWDGFTAFLPAPLSPGSSERQVKVSVYQI